MADDPFLYPGTRVLRNKKGLRDPVALDKFERQATATRLYLLETKPIRGVFDLAHLQAVHKFIFQDVYPWAGKLREGTGTMTKRRLGTVVQYGNSTYAASEATRVLRLLACENYLRGMDASAFAGRLAFFYSELDAVHPFREGNSRTLRAFTSQLAQQAGHDLDWRLVSNTDDARNTLYRARDAAVMDGTTGLLEALTAQALALVPAPAPQARSGRTPVEGTADAPQPLPAASPSGSPAPTLPEDGASAVLKAVQRPAPDAAGSRKQDPTWVVARLDGYSQRRAEAKVASERAARTAHGQLAPAPEAPSVTPKQDHDPEPGF